MGNWKIENSGSFGHEGLLDAPKKIFKIAFLSLAFAKVLLACSVAAMLA